MILHDIDQMVILVCGLFCVFSHAEFYMISLQTLLSYWVRLRQMLLVSHSRFLLMDASEKMRLINSEYSI